MNKLTAILLLVFCAADAMAFYLSGVELLAACRDDTPLARVRCETYIASAIDSYRQWVAWGDLKRQFCLPGGISSAQLAAIVINQLEEDRVHYHDLHKQASAPVLNALIVSFPCP